MEGFNGKRIAVLVGCNYQDTEYELQGCINDVLAMRDTLIERFGFSPDDVELLTDEPESKVMPTGANIKKALDQMADQAEEGDVLYFHYSGHGTLIPSLKEDEPSRKDEAIVPCDFNLITDLDFRLLVNRLPAKSSFTVLSDSCHSGGLIDKEKEQIGPSATTSRSDLHHHSSRSKMISSDLILEKLKRLTSIDAVHIGAHLKHHFKDDASLRFCLTNNEIDSFSPSSADAGILLSGCQTNETSADVNGDESGEGMAFGAFSNAVQAVLREDSGVISNKEVVMRARRQLQDLGFRQHPCLYCSDSNADAPFLWQP
ncbi:Metacaspase-9-like protein [Drosera capensis]